MAVVLSRGPDRYQAGLYDTTGVARLHKASIPHRGALLLAGNGGDDHSWYTEGGLDTKDVDTTYALIESEIPTMCIATETLWGNDAMQTRITNARTHAQANYGWASGTIFIVAVSGGCIATLNWARNNPTLVGAVALIVPAVDLEYHHDNGYDTQIDTAYTNHAGYLTALGTHSPAENPAAHEGIPIKAWISDNDTTAPFALAQTFIDAIDSAERVSLGSVGHVAAGSSVDYPAQIREFFQAQA